MSMESVIQNPKYITPWEIEKYDFNLWNHRMIDNWQYILVASSIYVILVHWGQQWMEFRKPFNLQGPLILWNLFLTIGSFIMFIRLLPEFLNEIQNYGTYHSICNRDQHTITTSYWNLLFTLSKVLEFGDTAFVVLRKQKLLFLHWYHHISVATYCFYVCGDFDPAGRWFSVMNTFIHTLMYGYYTCKAMRITLPKKMAMAITTMQILQMLVGVSINIISFIGKASGQDCCRPYKNMILALIMYGSYFYLFLHFYQKAYGKKVKKE